MRKLVTLAAVFAACVLTNAQPHLDYEGIEICGDITTFSNRLNELGFEFMNKSEDMYFFTGKDPDLGEVLMEVACLPEEEGRTVYAVMMTSKALMSFITAESIYKRTQRQLDRQYGDGFYDEWIDEDLDTDDINRIRALVSGKGRYYSEYNLPEGMAVISIINREAILYVTKSYIDKEGGNIMQKLLK